MKKSKSNEFKRGTDDGGKREEVKREKEINRKIEREKEKKITSEFGDDGVSQEKCEKHVNS